MAWLQTGPEVKGKEGDARIKKYDDPPLPTIENGLHLIDYLYEVGPGMSAGMGYGPVSFQELRAWSIGTAKHLCGWEIATLRALSSAYVDQMAKSKKADCPAPWAGYMDAERRAEVSRQIGSIFKGLKR